MHSGQVGYEFVQILWIWLIKKMNQILLGQNILKWFSSTKVPALIASAALLKDPGQLLKY